MKSWLLRWCLVISIVVFVSSEYYKRCRKFQFLCKNGKCIPDTLRCDGNDNCGDNSDEICDHHESFTCSDSNIIYQSQLCDGKMNCENDEDPKICVKNKCSIDQFMCRTHPMNCISQKSMCNNVKDCVDGSDESPEACEIKSRQLLVKCDDSIHFQCENKQLCISRIYHCDGKSDCSDQSDEKNCSNLENSEVIKQSLVDSVNHSLKCLSNEFYCGDNSTSPCISMDWYCDGSYDCIGNDNDERNCPNFKCSPDKPNKCKTYDFCYDNNQRCDGHPDCSDKSDEELCSKSSQQDVSCDPINEFKCVKNNTCIAFQRVCDNINDCGDESDERPGGDFGNCKKFPCKINNGGCEQKCVSFYSYRKCLCKPGFKIDPSNNTKCIDIDECADQLVCSHKCKNFLGSYKCECIEGFRMSSDNKQCLAVGEKFLLYSTKNSIRELRLLRHYMDMLYSPKEKTTNFFPIGIDFDYKSKIIFWTQFEPNPELVQIDYSVSKTGKLNHKTLVHNRIHSPVGLAYDWIHGLLFWSDIHFNEISVINITNGMRRTLVKLDKSSKVRSIVVHPKFRRIYWTDRGKTPKIECIGMDGQDRKILIKDGLLTPNGLALDYYFDDLYWVDVKARKISAYNLKTFKRREVVSHLDAYGFAIDVFEDWLYLSDWHNEKIIQIHKKTGEPKILVSSPKAMGMKLFHQLAQPENIDNVCINNSCQYLCLPTAMNLENHVKFRCSCPDFSYLLKDGLTCTPAESEYVSKVNAFTKFSLKVKRSKVNVYLVVGLVIAIVLIISVLLVGLGIAMYRNYIRRVIKRATNFNNPTYYNKTSNLEIQLFNADPLLPDVYDSIPDSSLVNGLISQIQSDEGLQMVATE